jgi:hypothetical protein
MRDEGEKNTERPKERERFERALRENLSNPGETEGPTFRRFMVGDVRDFR